MSRGGYYTIIQTIRPSTASFDSVIKPLADAENSLLDQKSAIAASRYASPDKAMQYEGEEADKLLQESGWAIIIYYR
jgi:metallopeptidase MepB